MSRLLMRSHSQMHSRSCLQFKHGKNSKAATLTKEIVVQLICFLSVSGNADLLLLLEENTRKIISFQFRLVPIKK